MKYFIKSFFAFVVVTLLAVATSCSESDSPADSPRLDYSKFLIGRMDLTGAKQIALKTNNSQSRAIDGEYLSSGLYKIDKDDNISAVGVYFTTDKDGNRLEKEYKLRVVPNSLIPVSDKYLLVMCCQYYDQDGDIVQDHWENADEDDSRWIVQSVPYYHLLVRLNDGKVWCVDNILDRLIGFGGHEVYPSGCIHVTEYSDVFKTNANGDLYALYYTDSYLTNGDIYKFYLSSNDASFEQITATGLVTPDFEVTANGIVSSGYESYYEPLFLSWPQSGYQHLEQTEIWKPVYGDKYYDNSAISTSVDNKVVFVNNNGNPGAIVNGGYDTWNPRVDIGIDSTDIARYYDISIDDTPGSASLDKKYIALDKSCSYVYQSNGFDSYIGLDFSEYNCSWYTTKDYILVSNRIGDMVSKENSNSRLTKIDLKKRTWTVIKDLDYFVHFGTNNLYYDKSSTIYMDKLWTVDKDRSHMGLYWLDLKTLEDGFSAFTTNIPEWMENKTVWAEDFYTHLNKACDGFVRYSGTNPANGNTEEIVIDMLTGEVTNNVTTPKYMFETLINLN